MDPKYEEFFRGAVQYLPESWSMDQKASELGQYAVEGIAYLPELDVGQGSGVSQKEFDQAVEEAYTFFRGEALRWLQKRVELGI